MKFSIPLLAFIFFLLSSPAFACSNLSADTTLTQNYSTSGTCFNITADNIILDCAGHSITGEKNGYGIQVDWQSNITIKNCIITNFTDGIRALNTTDSLFANNNISNSTYGIYAHSLNSSRVEGNKLYFSEYGFKATDSHYNSIEGNAGYNNSIAIWLSASDLNNLTSNTLTDNIGDSGIYISDYSDNNRLEHNVAQNSNHSFKTYYSSHNYFFNNTAYDNQYIGFYIYRGSNVSMMNNTAYQNNEGIYFYHIDDSIISGNTVYNFTPAGIFTIYSNRNRIENNNVSMRRGTNSANGIYIMQSDYTNITNNLVYDSYRGFLVYSGADNNLLENNTAYNHARDAYHVGAANDNTFINNTAYTSQIGFHLYGPSILRTTLRNNLARNNTQYGFALERYNAAGGARYTVVENNTAYGNTQAGIYLYEAPDTNITNNLFYSNGQYGIRIYYYSHRANILNNTVYACPTGVNLYRSSNCLFDNNTVENATNTGFNGQESSGINITNNHFYNTSYAIMLNTEVDDARIINNTAYAFSTAGLYAYFSNNTYVHNLSMYGDTADDIYVRADATPRTLNFSEIIIAGPTGNFSNSLNISIEDTVDANSGYSISWTENSTSIPTDYFSFRDKFLDISTVTGTTSIDSFYWYWSASEVTGDYIESKFEIWKYSASWSLVSNSPDTSSHSFHITNLDPASDYGILQNNLTTCQVISSSGSYQLAANAEGAPVSVSGISGISSACLILASSNIDFSCNGHTITNNGTANAAAILINGSTSTDYTNVTIRDCPGISSYEEGIYIHNSREGRISNTTSENNTNNGISIVDSAQVNITNSVAYGNTASGIYIYSSTNNIISNNIVYNNLKYGISLFLDSHYNNLTGNSAHNDSVYGYLLYNSSNNTLAGNYAHNSTDSGFLLLSSSDNNLTNNVITDAGIVGIYLNLSSNGNILSANIAANSSGNGFIVYMDSTNNLLTNNAAYNLSANGFIVHSNSNSNTLTNNAAYNNSDSGFYLYSNSGNNLTNNDAYNNTQYGILLTLATNTILSDNRVYNNSGYGFLLYSSTGNNLTGSNATGNHYGFAVAGSSHGNSFIQSRAYGNSIAGIVILDSNNNLIDYPAYVANNAIGINITNSNNTMLNRSKLYNNTLDFYAATDATARTVYLYDAIFDNPLGNNVQYTNLSVTDTVESNTAYSISWATNSSALPSNYISFGDKFTDIIAQAGTVSIDAIAWHWLDSELTGYDESKFELWKYNATAGWASLNSTPDTSANTFTQYAMNPASDYGILQNNLITCQVISAPGSYQLAANAEGAPETVTGIPDIAQACLILASSNIDFSCNGHTITNNGTANAAAIIINGSAAIDYTNVTIRDCPGISEYEKGIYIYNSKEDRISNITSRNNTEYGVFASTTSNINITDSIAHNNTIYGFYFNSSSGFLFTNNTARNNVDHGIYIYSGSGNTIAGNYLHDNLGSGFIIQQSINNIIANNTAHNNPGDGFWIYTSSGNTITNNTAYLNGWDGFRLFANADNNTLRDNVVYNNSLHGFLLTLTSINNNFTNNTAHNNLWDGFICYSSSNYNSFTNNTAYLNAWNGFRPYLSPDNNYTNNTAYLNGQSGFHIFSSSGIILENNTAHSNTQYGLKVENSDNVNLTNTHAYNNTLMEFYAATDGTPRAVYLTSMIIDSSSGNYQNYTNLSITDTLEASSAYSIKWASNSSALPTDRVSFAGKFANISTAAGTVSIDTIAWHWLGSELAGYDESKFELWKYNASGWTSLNSTPDTSANTFTQYAMNPASDYGILQENASSGACVDLGDPSTYAQKVVNASGIYYINLDTTLCTGTYLYSALGDSSSNISAYYPLIYLNSSSISLDCGDSILAGNGTTDSTAIFSDSHNNLQISNCIIHSFAHGTAIARGLGSSQHILLNNSVFYNNTGSGVRLLRVNNLSLHNITAYDNEYGIRALSYVTELDAHDLILENNTYGVHSGGSGSAYSSASFDNLRAYNNTNAGIYAAYITYFNITNSNISGNGAQGIYFNSHFHALSIADSTIEENAEWDALLIPASAASCDHSFSNVVGSGGRPILFSNSSSLSNQHVSELIVCGAQGSSSYTNITVDGSAFIDNNALLVVQANSATFSEVNSSNNLYGIYLYADTGLSFDEVAASNNAKSGIYFNGPAYTSISNLVADSNTEYGIYYAGGQHTSISNATFDGNNVGINVAASTLSIDNFTITNSATGINLLGTSNNFTDFTIHSCTHGVHRLQSVGGAWGRFEEGTIYNCTGIGIGMIVGAPMIMHNLEIYDVATAISMDRTNVDINNLSIHDLSGSALLLEGTKNSQIRNVEIESISGWAIYSEIGWATVSTNNTYTNISIYDSPYYVYQYPVSYADASHFSNFTIGYNNSVGKVNWDILTINQSSLAQNTNIILNPYFASLNHAHIDSGQFSAPANITIYTEDEQYQVFSTPSFETSRQQIITNGMPVYPKYENLSGGTKPELLLTFGVDSFSSYTARLNCFFANESNTVYSLLGNAWGNKTNPACIEVTAENVTINCSGHTITGTFGGTTWGIRANNTQGLLIKDCIITNYTNAVEFNSMQDSVLQNNTAHTNLGYGFYINGGSGINLTDNTAYNNSNNAGFYFGGTDNLVMDAADAYNNAYGLWAAGASSNLDISGLRLSGAIGPGGDHVMVAIADSLGAGEEYSIAFSENSQTLPSGRVAFENKFANLSTQAGSPSINTFILSWHELELPGYAESKFELWEYSGAWSNLNSTPDTAANTLHLHNLNPASDYGILQNNFGPIEVTLNSPIDGYTSPSQTISFTCSATANETLQNITLYGNWSGGWHPNETAALSGNSDSHTFTKTLPVGTYLWNCLGHDATTSDWGDNNYTFTINLSLVSGASISGANVTEHSQSKWANNISAGNFVTEGGNVSNVSLSTNASTEKWAGTYGNITGTLVLAEYNQSVFMYTWDWNASSGGEVCVSQNQNPAWNIWIAATAAELDSAWGFSPTDGDSAANTFTDSSTSLSINGRSFSTTGTYTYSTAGSNIWQVGAINVTGPTAEQSFAFCVNITNSTQNYNGKLVGFQMMFPTTEGGGPGPLETYYFFAELS